MRRSLRDINIGLDRFSGIYLFAVFIAVFGIWAPDSFLTGATLHSVASEQAVAGIVGLAALIPVCAGHYDLSVGANAGLTGICSILLQVQLHWSVVPAVIAGVVIGAVVGAANAIVVVWLRVSSFIGTLAMGTILAAVLTIATGNNQPQPLVSNAWNNLTQYKILGFQSVVVFLIVLAFIVWWFLDHTPAGRYIRATGGNPDAARLSGVRIDKWITVSFLASGGIAGLGGVLYTSLTGPSLSFGPNLLLPAFAAVFLGSTQLYPGKFNVWGTMIAIYVLATGVEGLDLVSQLPWIGDMFNGVALIIAVSVAVNRQNSVTRRALTRSDEPDDTALTVIDAAAVPADGTPADHSETGRSGSAEMVRESGSPSAG